jgi:LytTr DNA-binding domain
MPRLNIAENSRAPRSLPNWAREDAYGFLYWLAFLLVLEPGNVFRALQSGHELAFDHEARRIVAAALLGTSVTPIALMLTRRFPLLGSVRRGHALVHAAGIAALALGLIVASCFLAAWLFEGKWSPSIAEIRDQFIGNWLLLVFALCAFSAIAHVAHFFHRTGNPQISDTQGGRLTRIPIKTRGRLGFLNLTDVDWIESQGNYLALHVGSSTHMIRETSTKFETQLDPGRFVRIHRRSIVAIDRIRDLKPVANGDAILRLVNGIELRASRRYREAIRKKWPGLSD